VRQTVCRKPQKESSENTFSLDKTTEKKARFGVGKINGAGGLGKRLRPHADTRTQFLIVKTKFIVSEVRDVDFVIRTFVELSASFRLHFSSDSRARLSEFDE